MRGVFRIGATFGLGALLAAVSCRQVLGLGDPTPYPDGGASSGFAGEQPVVTESSAACGNADLVIDPENCGRCGHDCRGGRCERARCSPQFMTTADSDVFAVHNGRVYAVDKQQLWRVESNGDRLPLKEPSDTLAAPVALLASDQHIVWSGPTTGVRVCSVTGCSDDDPIQLSTGNISTGPLAEIDVLGGLYPYIWANFANSTVEKAASPGAPVVLSTDTHIDGAVCPPMFAEVDGGAYVYDTPGKHHWVYRGTEPTGRDAGGADVECAIAANSTSVFYTDDTTIWRSVINPDATLAPRTAYQSGLVSPKVLAVDESSVYWASATPQTNIMRCPLNPNGNGCTAPEVMVEAIPTVTGMKEEGSFLYYSTFLNQKLGHIIYKVAK